MSKIKNQPSDSNNSATLETLDLPEIICDARCKICGSSYLKQIHDLKKTGKTYRQIAAIAKKELGFKISSASICRHFKAYLKQKTILSAQIIQNDLIDEATKQSVHITKLVSLIDAAFSAIMTKVNSGLMIFTIDDLDKLMKLRYQILSGRDTDESDVLAIFQKASQKYGLTQGVLFRNKSSMSGLAPGEHDK